MSDDSYIIELKENIKRHINSYVDILSSIRSNKVSASTVENILVDCYGSKSPLKNLANIVVQPPNVLIIEPWDASILNEVAHAIETSPLNINPQKDQNFLKLIFPALTTDRREQLIKMVNTEKEKARVEIKKIREDAVKKTNNDFKDRTISEDQKFYLEKEIQKVIEETNTKIDDLTNKKETELRNN